MAYSAPQYRHKALDLPRPLRQERPVLDQHLPDLLEASDRIEVVAHLSPWSVRELKRQIDSNYYIRSGWSHKPQLLANRLAGKIEKPSLREEIK